MNILDITKQIRVFADQLESQNAPESEKPDPYAALKKAHAEGKVIQRDINADCDHENWRDEKNPDWKSHPSCYRIKPEPAFQLPPPPPGMEWHRTDGWQEGDLPQGWRPIAQFESRQPGDEWRDANSGWSDCRTFLEPRKGTSEFYRTSRPLTFMHAGKTWTWHRPGDPMPCKEGKRIYWLYKDGVFGSSENPEVVGWERKEDKVTDIIGWCYADEKKTVPLGPEDVPPGSVFRPIGWSSIPNAYVNYEAVVTNGVRTIGKDWGEFCSEYGYLPWLELHSEWQINRSIPLTGKWNPDAWEPCSKQTDA